MWTPGVRSCDPEPHSGPFQVEREVRICSHKLQDPSVIPVRKPVIMPGHLGHFSNYKATAEGSTGIGVVKQIPKLLGQAIWSSIYTRPWTQGWRSDEVNQGVALPEEESPAHAGGAHWLGSPQLFFIS